MLLKSTLLLIVGAMNVLIGLIVLTRDYRKLQNRLFFLFSLALGGWVIGIGGFLMTGNPTIAFHWAKAYYFFPLVVAASMLLFSLTFPYNDKILRKTWIPLSIISFAIIAALLFDSTFVTTRLVYHEWGKEIVLNKVHYLIYSVYLLGCFSIGLIHTYRKSQLAQGLARAQLRFYFTGFLITSFFGVYFNLILPWFGNYRLIWLGPLFTNVFVMAIAFSIVKHRLFDVRFVVARSLTYISSLSILAALYGFVVFGVAQYAFNIHLSIGLQIALSVATGFSAIIFQRVKSFFDKATSKLFYRDAYDPQLLFNEFNKAIVSTIDIDVLLRRTSQTIIEHIKAEYCVIGVKDSSDLGYRIVGTQQREYSAEEIEFMRHITPFLRQAVITTDDLPDEQSKIKNVLNSNDISVLARLAVNPHSTKEGLGYIVMGRKKSGNLYTKQDIAVIETLSNELIIAIQNALRFEEIERFNETLRHEIEVATRQLRESNLKLKRIDRQKDEFIGMASHQLRTPLTSIKGYVSLVLDGDSGRITAMQRKLLEQAFTSSQRMVYLIADLLNVSRLKSGKFVIERVSTNLSKMITDEMEQLKSAASSHDISIVFDPPIEFPTLMLDETKTRQVVMNFLDNAIYYTPKGGHIIINLRNLPNSIEFEVVDDGIGVPKDERHHLFTKFYRAKNAQRARPDGTGLGLYMAKKVIVAQGGAIIFDSKEGVGSKFGFSFPKELTPEIAQNKIITE